MSSNHKKGVVVTYEVDRIVDQFFDGKKMLYEVKWKGYADEDNTWQPLAHLQQVPEKVKEWEKQRNSRNSCKSWQGKVEPKGELKYMPKLKKSETSRTIRKEKETKKSQKYEPSKQRKVVDKPVSLAKKFVSTSKPQKQSHKLFVRSLQPPQTVSKQDPIDKRDDFQKLIDNSKLRKDLGLQKINMAKDSVVIIVQESISQEGQVNKQVQPAKEATKEGKIPLCQRRAVSTQVRELIKSSRRKADPPEIIDIEEPQPNEEQRGQVESQKGEEDNIIRDELDSIPELPKMAEQINANNMNFFFQEPAQGLILPDATDYSCFEQIVRIYKEDGLVLCSVATKAGDQTQQVSYDLLLKNRADLLSSFFDGRYPFK